jgi:hypothetical protein
MHLSYWGWAQGCSKHVEDSNKHIREEIVRQVGHVPESGVYLSVNKLKTHSQITYLWPASGQQPTNVDKIKTL